MSTSTKPTKVETPNRQIRAHLPTPTTITVYQAYSEAIASAAVREQNLSASPLFAYARMTWIKPSWCWMMYRAGYSYKDERQVRILALTMSLDNFWGLLRRGRLATDHEDLSENRNVKEEGKVAVRVQWDPERDVRIRKLDASGGVRSIQIGIGRSVSEMWAKEMVLEIKDVTAQAREMKRVLDEEVEEHITKEQLVSMGLMPVEVVVDVPEDIKLRLEMD